MAYALIKGNIAEVSVPHGIEISVKVKTNSKFVQKVELKDKSGAVIKSFTGSGEHNSIAGQETFKTDGIVHASFEFSQDSGGSWKHSALNSGGPYLIGSYNLLVIVAENGDDADYNDSILEFSWAKNEPIDRRCLENMRSKYGVAGVRANPELEERMKMVPALRLITMDTVEIVKRHADDWKFLTLSGLTAEEMRAIRANLPQFSRNQLRQLAWCQRLDDMIEKAENTAASPKPKPRAATRKITFAPPPHNPYENKNTLLDQIRSRQHS